tara:strand:+ start:89 stop:364 length:276 start_codon:yes stop_codon:yes gene_type:complete
VILTTHYFFESLQAEAKNISVKPRYLLIVKFDNLAFLLNGERINAIQNLWLKISSACFPISNLWAKYDNESVVGRVNSAEDAKALLLKLKK